jgi:hypothetical protein
MDQKTYLMIELTLFMGGSIHFYNRSGELLLVIAEYPETD